jgi:hypothetical protein
MKKQRKQENGFLVRGWYFLEDKYFSLLDFLDARGIPVFRVVDPLHEMGVSSFLVFSVLFLLLAAGFVYFLFLASQQPVTVEVALDSKTSEGFTVKAFQDGLEVGEATVGSDGKARLSLPPGRTELKFFDGQEQVGSKTVAVGEDVLQSLPQQAGSLLEETINSLLGPQGPSRNASLNDSSQTRVNQTSTNQTDFNATNESVTKARLRFSPLEERIPPSGVCTFHSKWHPGHELPIGNTSDGQSCTTSFSSENAPSAEVWTREITYFVSINSLEDEPVQGSVVFPSRARDFGIQREEVETRENYDCNTISFEVLVESSERGLLSSQMLDTCSKENVGGEIVNVSVRNVTLNFTVNPDETVKVGVKARHPAVGKMFGDLLECSTNHLVVETGISFPGVRKNFSFHFRCFDAKLYGMGFSTDDFPGGSEGGQEEAGEEEGMEEQQEGEGSGGSWYEPTLRNVTLTCFKCTDGRTERTKVTVLHDAVNYIARCPEEWSRQYQATLFTSAYPSEKIYDDFMDCGTQCYKCVQGELYRMEYPGQCPEGWSDEVLCCNRVFYKCGTPSNDDAKAKSVMCEDYSKQAWPDSEWTERGWSLEDPGDCGFGEESSWSGDKCYAASFNSWPILHRTVISFKEQYTKRCWQDHWFRDFAGTSFVCWGCLEGQLVQLLETPNYPEFKCGENSGMQSSRWAAEDCQEWSHCWRCEGELEVEFWVPEPFCNQTKGWHSQKILDCPFEPVEVSREATPVSNLSVDGSVDDYCGASNGSFVVCDAEQLAVLVERAWKEFDGENTTKHAFFLGSDELDLLSLGACLPGVEVTTPGLSPSPSKLVANFTDGSVGCGLVNVTVRPGTGGWGEVLLESNSSFAWCNPSSPHYFVSSMNFDESVSQGHSSLPARFAASTPQELEQALAFKHALDWSFGASKVLGYHYGEGLQVFGENETLPSDAPVEIRYKEFNCSLVDGEPVDGVDCSSAGSVDWLWEKFNASGKNFAGYYNSRQTEGGKQVFELGLIYERPLSPTVLAALRRGFSESFAAYTVFEATGCINGNKQQLVTKFDCEVNP